MRMIICAACGIVVARNAMSWLEPASCRVHLWRFHGLRPANHPQRRLAIVSSLVCDTKVDRTYEHWCQRVRCADKAPVTSLAKIFSAAGDEISGSGHWTIRSARLSKPQPLLGEQRVTDLAVNVIPPRLHARAATGQNKTWCSEMVRRYEAWLAAEDNAVLRLARHVLLGRSGTDVRD